MRRSLRAISPVVATALLVLIAVAVSVLLYTWVSGAVSNQPTSSPGLQERIVIDSVSYKYNATLGEANFTIYVRNVGTIPVNISSAYIVATNGTTLGANTSITTVTIDPGKVGTVQVNNVPVAKGETVIAKVVTLRGVEATYLVTVG